MEPKIEPDQRKSKHTDEDTEGSRNLGGHLFVELRTRRRRSLLENFFTFSVVPSLLAWTVIALLVSGEFTGAVQVLGAAFAGWFVGWSFGDSG